MHLLRLDAEPPLGDRELEEIYAYPDGLTRPWVQVNFVASADQAFGEMRADEAGATCNQDPSHPTAAPMSVVTCRPRTPSSRRYRSRMSSTRRLES